ncbi:MULTISPECIES: hypothetical protein [Acidobacterium]|uniref:Uncharacterized protein n=1 Tax=Acidobacterium capsulatum (strain ATCC 51196 / DSM 11244 / BCRC 80197 / JCM 7670 / NBRC 15755 / NCIMB 13165 / 161) TaxID=240015 RepID=C1F9R7_ACIC5|nr:MULTISPECIES: hypothetical protein [Acidobacterium]ACO33051.1 hypothetical protein ACP_2226 [Acidobacterium capsulatum ATCC 51196]HCT62270.1 hypothetical protein [Acidobacterium sp.]
MDSKLTTSPSRAHESAVDRLIELASTGKPAQEPVLEPEEMETVHSVQLLERPSVDDLKELAQDPMWKTLLQFKGWLPFITRLLPLLDMATGHAQTSSSTAAALSNDLKQGVGNIQKSQQDLRITLQDQTLQLKRFEDQVARMRESTEKNSLEHSELVEDVKSMQSTFRNLLIVVMVLLLGLMGMVGYLLLQLHNR